MRNEILKTLLEHELYVSPGRMADFIMTLIEPELEKAAKWDKVKEIAAVCPVSGCPVYHDCNRDCLMHKIVNALEGEKEAGDGL